MARGRKTGGGSRAGIPNRNTAELKEYAGQYTYEAIDGIYKLATSPKSPPIVKLKAWEAILDRAVGKPTQAVEHSGKDGGKIELSIESVNRAIRSVFGGDPSTPPDISEEVDT